MSMLKVFTWTIFWGIISSSIWGLGGDDLESSWSQLDVLLYDGSVMKHTVSVSPRHGSFVSDLEFFPGCEQELDDAFAKNTSSYKQNHSQDLDFLSVLDPEKDLDPQRVSQFFIKQQQDINTYYQGLTVLHYLLANQRASSEVKASVLEILLRHKAKVLDTKTNEPISALEIAVIYLMDQNPKLINTLHPDKTNQQLAAMVLDLSPVRVPISYKLNACKALGVLVLHYSDDNLSLVDENYL